MKNICRWAVLLCIVMFALAACSVNDDKGMEFEQLKWPTEEIAKQIPVPKSVMANVWNQGESIFEFYLANTTLEEFKTYVEECKTKGFTLDAIEQENRYHAFNAGKYELIVEHQADDIMYVFVEEDRFDVEIKLIHSNKASADMYDIRVEIDGGYEDSSEKGAEAVLFDSELKAGKHILTVSNREDDDINGRFEFEVQEEGEYLEFKIDCLSNKVVISPYVESGAEKEEKKDDAVQKIDDNANSSNNTDALPKAKNEKNEDRNINNGCFAYSARVFMKRLDESDEYASGYNYAFMRLNEEEKLYYELMNIEDDYKRVGAVSFCKKSDEALAIEDDFTENLIGKITILIEDIQDVPTVLVAAMCGADPSLDFSAAYNEGLKIVEFAGKDTGYTYNEINYSIATDGEYYFIIITPAR